MSANIIKQHLIDPEICIRCYTCEETCQLNAISHNDDNVVVDSSKCNSCMDCIAPCPTGSIDNWRFIHAEKAYSVDEQLAWEELPEQIEMDADDSAASEAVEAEITALIEQAHEGAGGISVAPDSAEQPSINLYTRSRPVVAQVQGNVRVTDASSDADVRHIILNLGDQHFPVLEGQTVGVAPPVKEGEKPEPIRLYSVSSARDGEKRNANNLALTVKRETNGRCSKYLCDLNKGDKVELSGPFGSTFLMPNDPAANILMICTGTGSAPFRGFTERRRRAAPGASGKLTLYYGGQNPDTLPYRMQLAKIPGWLLQQHLVYSRVSDQDKEYVQDRMLLHADDIAEQLTDSMTHVYICGVKGMESGVENTLSSICAMRQHNWPELKSAMQNSGRFHVETY